MPPGWAPLLPDGGDLPGEPDHLQAAADGGPGLSLQVCVDRTQRSDQASRLVDYVVHGRLLCTNEDTCQVLNKTEDAYTISGCGVMRFAIVMSPTGSLELLNPGLALLVAISPGDARQVADMQ